MSDTGAAYGRFAEVYETYMEEMPYAMWLERIRGILEADGIGDGLVLELGCGTGTFTRMLADAGYDMIGLDASPDMLMEAQESEAEEHRGILYLCQPMQEMELYGTVRAIVSVCDSMNYLTEPEDFAETLRLANNYLDPRGLFLFDLRTAYHYATRLGDGTFADTREDSAYIWENSYDPETGRNVYRLTLFLEEEDGSYTRTEEIHEQRAIPLEEVRDAAEKAGMDFVFADDMADMGEVKETSERILVCLRERGK